MNKKNKDLIAIIICGVLLTIWVSLIISGSFVINKKPIHGNPIIATIIARTNESKTNDLYRPSDLSEVATSFSEGKGAYTYTITLNYNDNGTERNLDINRVNVDEKKSNSELVGKSIHVMPVSDKTNVTSTNEIINYSDDDYKIGASLIVIGLMLLVVTFFIGIFFMLSYFAPEKTLLTDIDMKLSADVE